MHSDGNMGGIIFVRFLQAMAGLSRFPSVELTTGFARVFTFGFTNGGPAGLVYTFIICWIGTVGIFCSLAEMASA